MNFIDQTHQTQISGSNIFGLVIQRIAIDLNQLRLLSYRKLMGLIDHFLPLNCPIFLSAPSKKSICNAWCPILACRALRSISGSCCAIGREKILIDCSSSWFFQSMIWFWCKSNWVESSVSVWSPIIAARATLT